jgi:hypothetical protein
MRHLKFLISIFIFFLFFSCDPVFWTGIVNSSHNDIILDIKFNKEEIEGVWEGRPYIDYVRGRINEGGSLLSFDSLNLIAQVKIKPEETFTIEGGVGIEPDFFGIEHIFIYGEDTVYLENKASMKKAFTQNEPQKYQLIIK